SGSGWHTRTRHGRRWGGDDMADRNVVVAEIRRTFGDRLSELEDRPAQLQHLAQSIDADGAGGAQGDPSARGYLLSHADPEDAWGLVPALWPAVKLALVQAQA